VLTPGGTDTVDFDRVTGVIKIESTAAAAVTELTIAAITETTAQTITITSKGDATAEDLKINNSAASTTTKFSLVGADGEDTLIGSSANDTITGAEAADDLQGGGGNNSVVGGAGADSITTNTTGTDTVHGSAAADIFVVTAGTMNITDLGLASDVDLVDIAAGATVTATVVADWDEGADVDAIDNQSTGVANAVFTQGAGKPESSGSSNDARSDRRCLAAFARRPALRQCIQEHVGTNDGRRTDDDVQLRAPSLVERRRVLALRSAGQRLAVRPAGRLCGASRAARRS
jgi:hypothetical protein